MKGKTMKQNNKVCMYYVAERLTDILKIKNKDKAKKTNKKIVKMKMIKKYLHGQKSEILIRINLIG